MSKGWRVRVTYYLYSLKLDCRRRPILLPWILCYGLKKREKFFFFLIFEGHRQNERGGKAEREGDRGPDNVGLELTNRELMT